MGNSNRQQGSLASNTQQNPKPSGSNNGSNKYQHPNVRNEHVNAITTQSDKVVNSPISPPLSSATNVPMQVDSEDEDEQVDEEIVVKPNQAVKPPAVPLTSTTPVATPVAKPAVVEPQVNPYKPKIPFPQKLKKDKLKEQYAYQGSYNGQEEAKATFLNAECLAIVQNQIPPKLEDPGSFVITCSLDAKLTCDALADIGASINLMPFSVYRRLSLAALKPTRMSIRLADHSFQYPMGIAENLCIKVGRFCYP
uniref:uncharacterized protein LOC122591472 n=1 Tax=Erigeron canadensis TaxID=72917 RepID=UPI001CB9CDEA|nr:uncharacterized protein LOC122591472 [Erigeron canadensis]